MKREWNKPTLSILGVEKTELGNQLTYKVDDVRQENGITHWSFES